MNTKQTFIYFLGMFALTFVVSAIVTFLYSLIVHGTDVVDWETAFRFAIIFGITLLGKREKGEIKDEITIGLATLRHFVARSRLHRDSDNSG